MIKNVLLDSPVMPALIGWVAFVIGQTAIPFSIKIILLSAARALP